MSRKILYLINPISGTRGKRSLREMIRQRTEEQGIEFSILPTDAGGDYSHLSGLIRLEGFTDIVICGGDGTVNAVAAALYMPGSRSGQKLAHPGQNIDNARPAPFVDCDIPLGIIPMGSGNGLAFAAGIPKDPARALTIVFAGKASYIDGLLINDQFSCMLCGIGLDGQVAQEFAGQPIRGLPTYIRITLKNFFSARPYPFRFTFPGGVNGQSEIQVEAFFVSIANGNQFGNHFTIAPKASLQDGLLDIVIAKRTNRLRFLLSVLRQVAGGYRVAKEPADSDEEKIIYFQTPSLVIQNPGLAPLHIDGDPKESATEFRIAVVPRAIRLIQP
jgi:diacylglycerol kinase (ATP)